MYLLRILYPNPLNPEAHHPLKCALMGPFCETQSDCSITQGLLNATQPCCQTSATFRVQGLGQTARVGSQSLKSATGRTPLDRTGWVYGSGAFNMLIPTRLGPCKASWFKARRSIACKEGSLYVNSLLGGYKEISRRHLPKL